MTKNTFIEQISNICKKEESFKDFLRTNSGNEIKNIKYIDGWIKIKDKNNFFHSSTNQIGTIFAKTIIGTTHPDYLEKTPMKLIDILRGNQNFELTGHKEIDSYFTGDFNSDNPIKVISFIDEKNEELNIIDAGNHRFTISKIIDSIVDDVDLFINDVDIIRYFMDYEFLDLLDKAENDKKWNSKPEEVVHFPDHSIKIFERFVIDDEKNLDGLESLPDNPNDWSIEKYLEVEKNNRTIVKEFLKKNLKV